MRKSTALKIVTGVAAILVALFVSCKEAGLGEEDTGSLKLFIAANASRSLGSKTIDAAVTAVEVKMTSVPADLYPPKMASATFNIGGTTVSIGQVKIGTWKVEIFLNNASGEQLYYGSDQVTISAGATTSANIEVFRTGGADLTIIEGVPVPILTPGTPEMVAKTYPLTITFPTGVTPLGANYIKYTLGTNGAVPNDPVIGTTTGSNDTINLTPSFTDTIKVKIFLADGRSSSVETFSYSRPYFSLAQGSYTGFQNVTLQSMRPGVTIRYTISEAVPGAEPTYEYGTLAGNNTVVQLTYPTSVLKAVSYFAGEPDSISEVASATYTLNVAPLIQVYIDGVVASTNPSTYNMGTTTPTGSTSGSIYLGNEGNGANLVIGYTEFTSGSGKYTVGDPTSLISKRLGLNEYTQFDLNFTPGGSTGTLTGTLVIHSNSSANPDFTINLTGVAHNAPTAAWLTGIDVYGAGDTGTPNVNGRYVQTDNKNSYTAYARSGVTTTYIFYDNVSYYSYILGYSGSWTSITNASVADMYDTAHVARYKKNSYTTSPLGINSYLGDSTDSWGPKYGTSPAPFITKIDGLNGKRAADNVAFSGFMAVGRTLTAYYNYSADSDDTESGTTFQWYRATPGTSTWNAISGATAQTYTLINTDIISGTQLKVEVTPKSVSGITGTTQYSTITAP